MDEKINICLPDTGQPAFLPGTVWLVGAGPGDPGLLTLHALHALQAADTIVYDALVSKDILKLAKPGAALEYAGKRGGKPSAKQPGITRRLIELAQAGQRVLRLKGGDPFLFGRGGEEALALAAAGIVFRFVPGVTAGVGGLAAAGIPMTHRTTGHSVTFVTGHRAGGSLPDGLDWKALATGSPTLVFYMALAHLEVIVAHLLANGLDAATPSALVSHATLPTQQVIEAPVAGLAHIVRAKNIEAPAILVIGDVVRLRRALDPSLTPQARALAAEELSADWHRVSEMKTDT